MQTFEQLETVRAGRDLTREQSRALFDDMLSGRIPEELLAEFLTALAAKGETVDEIAGAADAITVKATCVRCDRECIDTCGTGGDGVSTFNTSTAAALIAAAAGVVVAKHGNRSNLRVSGSAEVLIELGVNINAPVPVLERCLKECGIAFLFAPNLHPAFKHVAAVRKRIGTRTIFNLVAPLCNPAGVKRQLVGVSKPELTDRLARVLAARGAAHAWVVHGHDGLCDLSVTGPSQVCEVRDGQVRAFTVRPDDAGLPPAKLSDLLVDSPKASATVILDILEGRIGPPRHHAILNAAAALVISGHATDLPDGVIRAAEAIDCGAARATLQRLVICSHEPL